MSYQKEVVPNNFCGIDGQSLGAAKVVILPVPYEGTVSYGSGTAKGPEAIIQASRHMELYDIELGGENYHKPGVFTLKPLVVGSLQAEKMIEKVEKIYTELVAKEKFVIMLGGEHSISYAADKPLREKYPDLSVLQWDAHADLRDSWEGTKLSHACAMRRFYDHGKKIVQVGVRSMSIEEAEFIKKNKLEKNIFSSEKFGRTAEEKARAIKEILSRLSQNVYITIDLDGFDPSVLPATGTPEPGGLYWQDFLDLMAAVFQSKNVVGCDVVELAPIKGQPASDFLAALAAYKMIGYKYNYEKINFK
ncbi:MAG: agmatinase [Patescibacteria group bacterium]